MSSPLSIMKEPLSINEHSGAVYDADGEFIGCITYPDVDPEVYTVTFRGPVIWALN